jgi:hypothetical protein
MARFRRVAAMCAVVAMIAPAGTATAQTTSLSPTPPVPLPAHAPSGPAAAVPSPAPTPLPKTGMDVLPEALAASLLVALGISIRSVSRRRGDPV